MNSATCCTSWLGDREPSRASLLESRVMVEEIAARQEPRPTGPRLMERARPELEFRRANSWSGTAARVIGFWFQKICCNLGRSPP